MWSPSHKADPRGAELCRAHYSRRKPNSRQFMPPGETLVLIRPDAVWGWWRPHPSTGLKAKNGYDGWTCSLFARPQAEGPKSSELILAAERELVMAQRLPCGPSGLLTYVWPAKLRSGTTPGYCYRMAGYQEIGTSKDGKKTLFWKPWHLAGVAASGVPWERP